MNRRGFLQKLIALGVREGGSTLRPEFRGEHLMHATHNASMSYKARLLTEEGE